MKKRKKRTLAQKRAEGAKPAGVSRYAERKKRRTKGDFSGSPFVEVEEEVHRPAPDHPWKRRDTHRVDADVVSIGQFYGRGVRM